MNSTRQSQAGTLYLVSTPIGNLEDITIRAIRTLLTVPLIACEDTRRAGQLITLLTERYGSLVESDRAEEDRFIRYDNQKEFQVVPELIDTLERGTSVALISDAGTPLISDPGFRLVKEARKRHIPIEVIPGASALLTALVGSGMPVDTFTFLGYPPEKVSHQRKLFQNILVSDRALPSTYILYCAPHKLRTTLLTMEEVFTAATMTIARELTKVHEELWSGTITDAISFFTDPKGEFVLLFSLV